jgi:hypothetical protein
VDELAAIWASPPRVLLGLPLPKVQCEHSTKRVVRFRVRINPRAPLPLALAGGELPSRHSIYIRNPDFAGAVYLMVCSSSVLAHLKKSIDACGECVRCPFSAVAVTLVSMTRPISVPPLFLAKAIVTLS